MVASASGRHHDITGPESSDLATIAASAARQWGTALEYAGITPSEHWPKMAIAVEDPWWIYAYSTMFASIRGQRWAAASDEVHRLTGCSPTLLLPLEDERPSSRSAWSDCRFVRGQKEDAGDVAVSPITLFDRHGLSLAAPVAAAAYGYGSSAA